MEPRIEPNEGSGFYLYSFAPASGVGFYLTKDGVFKFDLITKEQSPLEGAALVAQRAEFDQVNADAYFTSYEALESFTSKKYLQDKKNTLYGLLFTHDLGEELNASTLRLLNESGFHEIEFSERAIPVLSEIAKRRRVTSVFQLASDLGLQSVQGCLSNELSTLTFQSMREMIDEAQHANLAIERPPVFEETLGLLRSYVSAAGILPGFANRSIVAFCDYAERNVTSLSRKGVRSLSYLLDSFERSSATVNFAQAIAFREPRSISDTFTAALFHSKAEAVTALCSRFTELRFGRDDELVAAGRQFLELGVRWTVPPFWLGPHLVELTTEQGEVARESVRSVAQEIYLGHRGQAKFNGTRSNFQFSIDFTLPDRLFSVSRNLPWYAENVSFWLAFYAEPDFVLDSLYPFSPSPYSFFEDLYYAMRRLDLEMSEQALFYFHNASNLLSLALMYSKTPHGYEDRDMISRLIIPWISDLPRDLKPSHPFSVLLSNVLAWALQTRQDELVNRIITSIRNVPPEEFTLSPFIRIIL